MLQSVGQQVPSDDVSKAVFYLVKEVGLSHNEIFGGTEYVNFVEEVERNGLLGDTFDYVFGKQKKERTEKVETKGMSLKAFTAYLELFQEHQEEQKKQQKKAKMRQNLKGNTFT